MLPVAHSAEDFLVGGDRQPIWPVRDVAEESALRALAATFGERLRLVHDGQPGRSERRPELVVGLGSGSEGPAQLYGQLTCRDVRIVAGVDRIFDSERVEVLICPWQEVTFAALEAVEDYSRRVRPVGLVVSRSPDGLRRQVLIRSATSRVCGPVAAKAVLVSSEPEGPGLHAPAPGLLTLAGRFDAATARAALASRAPVVGVSGHGDGLDMQFGAEQIICPLRDGALADSPEARTLDCVAGGFCYRVRRPLGEALADERLLSPAEAHCRLAVLWTCFAIPATRSVCKPEVSLLRGLMESPTVGAVFATWGVVLQNAGNLRRFLDHGLSGCDLGGLMRWFYRDSTQSGGTRACLFGDPRARILPTEAPLGRC